MTVKNEYNKSSDRNGKTAAVHYIATHQTITHYDTTNVTRNSMKESRQERMSGGSANGQYNKGYGSSPGRRYPIRRTEADLDNNWRRKTYEQRKANSGLHGSHGKDEVGQHKDRQWEHHRATRPKLGRRWYSNSQHHWKRATKATRENASRRWWRRQRSPQEKQKGWKLLNRRRARKRRTRRRKKKQEDEERWSR